MSWYIQTSLDGNDLDHLGPMTRDEAFAVARVLATPKGQPPYGCHITTATKELRALYGELADIRLDFNERLAKARQDLRRLR